MSDIQRRMVPIGELDPVPMTSPEEWQVEVVLYADAQAWVQRELAAAEDRVKALGDVPGGTYAEAVQDAIFAIRDHP